MALSRSLTRILTVLYLICAVFADPTYVSFVNTPGSGANVTVAVNVPTNGTDDLYFRFSASALYQWAAFGFGGQMNGALMFVAYSQTTSNNVVVVSARTSTGDNHPMPQLTKNVTLDILNGSTITDDGVYVVNAHCKGCRTWNGVDVNNTAQPMIYALGPQGEYFSSNDPGASILQHSQHASFTLDLTKAVGQAGVPIVPTNNNLTKSNTQDVEEHVFPVVFHTLLMVCCFLFILPGGYLLLRVFNRVWLHAGIQVFGVLVLLGGVATGILTHIQEKRQISYHQILGVITSFAVLSAMTFGMIGHHSFKKRKMPSPLMKFHRIAGPGAIVLGWGTCISGYIFANEVGHVLYFGIILLGVIIFVGGIGFLMRRRRMRRAARSTPAAQNFNNGHYGGQANTGYGGYGQDYYAPHGESVPLQTFGAPTEQHQHQHQQAQWAYSDAQKAPNTHTNEVRI